MTDSTGRPAEPPDDVDATFEALVADFDAEPAPGQSPESIDETAPDQRPSPATDATPGDDTGGWGDLVAATAPDETPEPDETFRPAAPPPLPRVDALTWLAWVGAIGAPTVYLVFAALGWTWQTWQIGIVLVSFLGGFAVLVSRLRDDSSDDHDPSSGAVV